MEAIATERPRGRPRKREPSRYLSARVPASVYDPVKAWADDHAEAMSAIVIEALRAYLDREILRKCPVCGAPNDEDSQYCKACGAGLTADLERNKYQAAMAGLKAILEHPDVYEAIRALKEEGEASRPIAPDQATLIPEPDQT